MHRLAATKAHVQDRAPLQHPSARRVGFVTNASTASSELYLYGYIGEYEIEALDIVGTGETLEHILNTCEGSEEGGHQSYPSVESITASNGQNLIARPPHGARV